MCPSPGPGVVGVTGVVGTEVLGSTLLVTLDRPTANAIDAATSVELYEAFDQLRRDATLRAGVLTGAGTRFFSAGWDLKAAAAGEGTDSDWGPGGFAGITELHDLDKPVIAAVNGLAIGGGFELALAADLMVVAEHAELALPEAMIGLVADAGGLLRLPRALPPAIAKELLLTGRRMGAAEAERWGLANRVVAVDRLLDAALALADEISAAAPLAVAATLEVLREAGGHRVQDGFAIMRGGLPRYSRIAGSADAQEGPRAFVERRPPRWTGT